MIPPLETFMGERPQYSKYAVTFFDILRFRAIVDRGSPPEIANALQGLIWFKEDTTDLSDTSVSFVAFSDSVVRARKIPADPNPAMLASILEAEVFDLAMGQVSTTLNKIWVRGGLCVGDLYINENTVFGPAASPLLKCSVSEDVEQASAQPTFESRN